MFNQNGTECLAITCPIGSLSPLLRKLFQNLKIAVDKLLRYAIMHAVMNELLNSRIPAGSDVMSVILDKLFIRQTSETEATIDSYTDRLEAVVNSLSYCQPNVVLESQQWSRLAAFQAGGELYSPEEWAKETESGDPGDLGGAWIAYYWNRDEEAWDLAFVATWPVGDE